MSIPIYRQDALGAIARNTLEDYDKSLIFGEPRATPIERLVEWLGLILSYYCIKQDGSILGETVFNNMKIPVFFRDLTMYDLIPIRAGTIIIDDSLLDCINDGRLRFTIAHEIAHWLIHQNYYTNAGFIATRRDPETNPIFKKIEWQANVIATNLLMPIHQVKKAFYGFNGFNCASGYITAKLARLFDVSGEAMGIFLKDHKLI